jgi:hypothetical protein
MRFDCAIYHHVALPLVATLFEGFAVLILLAVAVNEFESVRSTIDDYVLQFVCEQVILMWTSLKNDVCCNDIIFDSYHCTIVFTVYLFYHVAVTATFDIVAVIYNKYGNNEYLW